MKISKKTAAMSENFDSPYCSKARVVNQSYLAKQVPLLYLEKKYDNSTLTLDKNGSRPVLKRNKKCLFMSLTFFKQPGCHLCATLHASSLSSLYSKPFQSLNCLRYLYPSLLFTGPKELLRQVEMQLRQKNKKNSKRKFAVLQRQHPLFCLSDFLTFADQLSSFIT